MGNNTLSTKPIDIGTYQEHGLIDATNRAFSAMNRVILSNNDIEPEDDFREKGASEAVTGNSASHNWPIQT